MIRCLAVAALVFAGGCKKEAAPPPPTTTATPAPAPAAPTPAPGAQAPGQPPANHGMGMPAPGAPVTPEKLADGRIALGPFAVAVPAGWTIEPTTSKMRVAQFELPAKAGEEAELIVYYFGEGGAGNVEANLDRWVGMIQQPSGKPSKDVAKIEKLKVAGQAATIVTVSGRYVTGGMPGQGGMQGQAPADKQDQTLVAAIIESPQGPYYWKLVGAKATVSGQDKALRQMFTGQALRKP